MSSIPEKAARAAQEAQRRHPEWHDQGVGIVQGSHWRSGFVAGAEWARAEALREAERAVTDLLSDPSTYSSVAVVGVIASHTALRALAEGTPEEPSANELSD